MADFKNLLVWRKAHALALSTHRIAGALRGNQNAALRNQLVRAAMSVPANIVEGSARRSDREFARFIRIALGSLSEMEYHLILAADLGMMGQSDHSFLREQLIDVRKMLSGLVRALEKPAPSTIDSAESESAKQQTAGDASENSGAR